MGKKGKGSSRKGDMERGREVERVRQHFHSHLFICGQAVRQSRQLPMLFIFEDRQGNRQRDRQKKRQRDRQKERQTVRQSVWQTNSDTVETMPDKATARTYAPCLALCLALCLASSSAFGLGFFLMNAFECN